MTLEVMWGSRWGVRVRVRQEDARCEGGQWEPVWVLRGKCQVPTRAVSGTTAHAKLAIAAHLYPL